MREPVPTAGSLDLPERVSDHPRHSARATKSGCVESLRQFWLYGMRSGQTRDAARKIGDGTVRVPQWRQQNRSRRSSSTWTMAATGRRLARGGRSS
jgi:hypothetical protein